jgi:hypothetical protein
VPTGQNTDVIKVALQENQQKPIKIKQKAL